MFLEKGKELGRKKLAGLWLGECILENSAISFRCSNPAYVVWKFLGFKVVGWERLDEGLFCLALEDA